MMEEGSLQGLSSREAEERRSRGEGETAAEPITKSKGRIIWENVFTLFNFLNFLIAALLAAVGAYSNMLFICIIILNIVIGIFQELKAKKLVDELSILNRPSVRIRRDGQDRKADLGELVRGDLMLLESGDQICSDAEIVEGSLEVNESLLTGESDAVVKEKGSGLLSGSFVISGKAYARVTHVGNENYAAKLAAEVKKEKRVHSELLGSMRKVTHFTSFLIVPLGILLFLEAFLLRQASVEEAVVSSAAGLLGMLSKGLVLLISVSLAAGVIRLARMKILVQNIYSLETLAHVDTLCLDKTGTITDGKLQVCGIIPVQAFEGEKMDALIRSYMAASDDNNAIFQALRQSFSPEVDCSIAVADGSDASRQISQIVLLDSDFTNLPQADSGKLPEDGAFPCAALRPYGDRHDYPDEPYCPVFAGRKADSDVPSAGFDFHGCSDTKLYPVYEAQNAYLRCHGGRNRLRAGTVSFAAGASGSHAVHGTLWSVRRGFMPAFRAGAG